MNKQQTEQRNKELSILFKEREENSKEIMANKNMMVDRIVNGEGESMRQTLREHGGTIDNAYYADKKRNWFIRLIQRISNTLGYGRKNTNIR